MAGVNKVLILGRLGKDPEIRYTADGKAVVSLSVATSTQSKDLAGKKTEYTEWHKVSAFNNAAEAAGKYLKKGDRLFVEGSLRTKKWVDQHGAEKYSTEIVAGRLEFLGEKHSQNPQNPTPLESQGDGFIDDTIPF
jgi:single-strand DNA-binding protein